MPHEFSSIYAAYIIINGYDEDEEEKRSFFSNTYTGRNEHQQRYCSIKISNNVS